MDRNQDNLICQKEIKWNFNFSSDSVICFKLYFLYLYFFFNLIMMPKVNKMATVSGKRARLLILSVVILAVYMSISCLEISVETH